MSTDSIFDDSILDEPGICKNCFRRTHDVEEMQYPNQVENRPITGDVLRYERFFKRPQDTVKLYPPDMDLISRSNPGGKNVCECGNISSRAKLRPLSKGDAISYTKHIAERLEEQSIIYDEDVLFDVVREEKSKADRQHEDDEIFKEAVSKAVSHAHAKEATA